MNPFQKIWRWLRSLGQRQAVKREIDEELRFHLEQRIAENMAAGMSSAEATRAARKQFGNVQSIREECRETRGATFGEETLRNIRFGLRMLRKNPGFTIVAGLTLALGIGANTAIFSVVNAVLLRPLPYAEPERLVAVSERNPRLGWQQYTVSLGTYLDWREQNSVFDDLAAAAAGGMATLTSDQEPEQVRTAFVSASFFPLLAVRPIVGRSFLTEEEQRGRADVILLSEKLWRSRFAANPAIINQPVQLNGRSFTVVGVMPARLRLFEPSRIQGWEGGLSDAEVWRPLVIWPDKLKWRNMREFLVLGRLKLGITLDAARNQMTAIARRVEQQFPDSNGGWGASVTPWQTEITARSQPMLLMLFGAAGLALLIATANLANLLLARTLARRREFSVRLALGARMHQIARQLLTESMVLACVGGVVGLLMGQWALQILAAAIPATLPRADEIGLDVRVFSFTVAVTLVAGLAFGLTPLLQLRRMNVSATLKQEGRGGGGGFGSGHIRDWLVGSEIALVTVLLIGAGLLTRSFWQLTQVHPGFNPEQVIAVDVSLGGRNYTNGQAMIRFVEKLLPRLGEIPGMKSVATVNGLPLDLARENMDIAINVEGQLPSDPAERLVAGLRQASPQYFATLHIPLIKGRSFTDRDNESAPAVALVNQTFARQFFADGEPIGKRIASPDFGPHPCEIIGVIRDVKHRGLEVPASPEVFRPHLQSCFSHFTVVMRTQLKPAETVSAVRAAVVAMDRDIAVYNARTLGEQVAAAGAPRRFAMLLMGLLAMLALGLGLVGVYGVVSCIVAERTREIGIRVALGAQRPRLMLSVIGRGMKWVIFGAVAGLAGAWVLARSLRSLLFEISPTDPVTFVVVLFFLGGTAVLACYFPARRAAKVDPMEALRHE